jgi:hypothetical protein
VTTAPVLRVSASVGWLTGTMVPARTEDGAEIERAEAMGLVRRGH